MAKRYSVKTEKNYKILDSKTDWNLIKSLKPKCRIVDNYNSQIEELWKIRNPKNAHYKNYGNNSSLENILAKFCAKDLNNSHGKWILYPWKETLVHVLDDNYFQELRTARNKFLINKEEQKAFQDYKVGIIGLSVGSNISEIGRASCRERV